MRVPGYFLRDSHKKFAKKKTTTMQPYYNQYSHSQEDAQPYLYTLAFTSCPFGWPMRDRRAVLDLACGWPPRTCQHDQWWSGVPGWTWWHRFGSVIKLLLWISLLILYQCCCLAMLQQTGNTMFVHHHRRAVMPTDNIHLRWYTCGRIRRRKF